MKWKHRNDCPCTENDSYLHGACNCPSKKYPTLERLFETLQEEGISPQLIHDDHGNWAVVDTTTQATIPKPDEILVFAFDKEYWEQTIQEAIMNYIERNGRKDLCA